jgi:hypothetical protein
MAGILEKAKRGLDWLQHGYLLVQLGGAIGVGKALQAILVTYTHIPPIWVTPLWLLTSAAMLALLVAIGNYVRRRQEQQQSTGQANLKALIAAPLNFDATEHFRRAHTSSLTDGVEKNIKIAAAQNQPEDREGFLAKLIGIGIVSYWFDISWAYIFKIQLLLLMELNRNMLPLKMVKPFYDKAAAEYPDNYKDYSFEAWLRFLKTQVLVIQQADDTVAITERGQDFLKYLVHWGRYVDSRKF